MVKVSLGAVVGHSPHNIVIGNQKGGLGNRLPRRTSSPACYIRASQLDPLISMLGSLHWLVMRNRTGSLALRNKAVMDRSLCELAGRIWFRIALGFTGRTIIRELFLRGLTLLDLHTPGVTQRFNTSHIASCRKVRQLLMAIALPNAPGTAQYGAGYGNQRWPDPI